MEVFEMLSEKDKPILVINKFKFRFHKMLANEVEKWCCTNKNCRSFFKRSNNIILKNVSRFDVYDHNHESNTEPLLTRQIIRNGIKRIATENIFERPSKLIYDALNEFGVEKIITTDMTSFRKGIYEARRKILPANLTSVQEIHDILNSINNKPNEVAECKEKWKYLRAVFIQNRKPASSDSEVKNKLPHYLSEAMQFVVPHIQAFNTDVGNVVSIPEKDDQQVDNINHHEIDSFQDSQPLSPTPSTISTSSVTTILQPEQKSIENCIIKKQPQPTSPCNKRGLKNDLIEDPYSEYVEAKNAEIASVSAVTNPNQRSEALKMFFHSLMPDLESMNDVQLRKFKRTCLQTIEDLLSLGTSSNSTQALHS